jgi:DNA-binding CsgD family transcriptional regulator
MLNVLAKGNLYQEIAIHFHLSIVMTKEHMTNIYKKTSG